MEQVSVLELVFIVVGSFIICCEIVYFMHYNIIPYFFGENKPIPLLEVVSEGSLIERIDNQQTMEQDVVIDVVIVDVIQEEEKLDEKIEEEKEDDLHPTSLYHNTLVNINDVNHPHNLITTFNPSDHNISNHEIDSQSNFDVNIYELTEHISITSDQDEEDIPPINVISMSQSMQNHPRNIVYLV